MSSTVPANKQFLINNLDKQSNSLNDMYQSLIIEMKKEKMKMTCFDVEGTIQSDYSTLASDDIKYLFKNDRQKYKRIFDQQLFALPKSMIHFILFHLLDRYIPYCL